MGPDCSYCITIPAKDEAGGIVATLRALHLQYDPAGRRIPPTHYEVIVLANNCSDRTAAVARSYGSQHPDFGLHVIEVDIPRDVASVGVARRLLGDLAVARLPPDGIICTTDADSTVDRHWLYYTEQALARGAQAVGGRIMVRQRAREGYRKIYLQDVTYRMLQTRLESSIDPCTQDPWPRHFQHFGPSIAVRKAAYLACGGMPAARCIEDIQLVWAMERIDIQVVHDPRIKVYTSDRESDRIDGIAFSHTLDEWVKMENEGRKPVVWGLRHCIMLYKWKVALRRAFYERRIGHSPALFELANYLGMSFQELEKRIVGAQTAGQLYQEFRHILERTHEFSDAPFEQAVRELRRFTRSMHLRPRPSASKRRAGSDRPAHSV
ncbi:hypothetical protein LEM8419_00726 [Neolewinella maritima]|uniref:Glycosyltransferase 2-like domain-containing protein n=1 Tax=Neolewinella maritima TaxID=1383882 RepID=A0ABM9AXJ2_9BACT|nr:hypothetical protein LEM8419_00726 [Neolewinella maritima]